MCCPWLDDRCSTGERREPRRGDKYRWEAVDKAETGGSVDVHGAGTAAVGTADREGQVGVMELGGDEMGSRVGRVGGR
jgi:hypothetical protein